MKIAFCTLGCKVNQYESQALSEMLEGLGYTTVKEANNPDILFVNSCTVTAESDRKTRQLVRKLRQNHPESIIVLLGCMPSAFPKSVENLHEADIVFGNTDHKEIPKLICEFLKTKKRIVNIFPHEKSEKFAENNITRFSERTRAYIKIEDGCNRFCSYCAIPYARGRVRSKALGTIKDEALKLAQNGFIEIVLVGINLSAFGSDSGLNICDAVKAAASPDGIKRVRLGSLEPDHISNEILLELKNVSKFCPQFHLSLQSGCDETLKRMNRHYDSAFYSDLVKRIRAIFPTASITTDVMVGFAGETEEEFNKSLKFVENIGFAKCHIFAYSKREGTRAATFTGQVDNATKKARSEKMAEVAKMSHNAFLKNLIETEQNVLIERVKKGIAEGYTENYTRIYAKTTQNIEGVIVKIKPHDYYLDGLIGEIIE